MKCQIDSCKKSVALEGLCRDHFIEMKERIYLDNTDMHNLGVVKWANDMLPEYMPNQTAEFHKEMLRMVLSLFDPFYKNRHERQANFVIFRGASKSTLLNMIFNEYILTHNKMTMRIRDIKNNIVDVKINEKFIVIASETGNSAEDFVVRLRDELTINERLTWFYKRNIEDVREDDTGEWTRRAFKYNGCYIMSAGVGQQIRGKIKRAYRPTLVFCDDIYSENNVKTEGGRKVVKDWFDRAIYNTIDELNGKLIVVGTILHEDTVLVENSRSKGWKKLQVPIMPLEKFEKFLKEHIKIDHGKGTCVLPYDDIEDEYERITKQRAYFKQQQETYDWELAWGDRVNLYSIALKISAAVQKRNLGMIYQEFFHVLATDEQMRIKPEYIQEIDFNIYEMHGYMWLTSSIFSEPLRVDIHLGLDFSGGTTDGDDACITVAGILSNNYIVIIDTIYGKYGERDDKSYNLNFSEVELDRDKIKKIGMMDEALRQAIQYKATEIKVGYSGSEQSRINTIRQLAMANKLWGLIITGRKQVGEGNKQERILDRLAPLYQAKRVFHRKGLDKLNYQLKYLMTSTEDDVVDATEVALYGMQAPSHLKVSQVAPVHVPIRWKKTSVLVKDFDWRVN